MPELEIYTTGGGYYLYDIFNYLAAFSGSGAFSELLYIGIVFGVGYTAVRVALTGNLQGTLQYALICALIGSLGVGAKARVVIVDSTHPLEIYGTVDNVPFLVALVGNLTSQVSHSLTRRMETLLSTPGDLTYQKHGMLFGATLMAQASRWDAVTPIVQAQMANFMENCMVDGANIGLVDFNELTRTGDLSNFISNNVPGGLAYYDEATEAVTGCADGWSGLNAAIGTEIAAALQEKAASLAPLSGSGQGVTDVAGLTGTLENFQTMMGFESANATSYLRQSMLIAALDEGTNSLIAGSGNSAAFQLYQNARAESQTRSSYGVVAVGATKWVPILKVVFEAMYYASFPIAMLLMLTPLGTTVFKGYFSGFLWLGAWEPLSAILHTMFLKASTGWYREHTTTFTGGAARDVLNWANHFGVQSVEQDIGLAAGYLMMSVPFLATAIFFGPKMMSSLSTSMLNVSQGAAIDTGREGATGNISLGNTSMNNMSANKYNTSSLVDTGRSTQILDDGTSHTTNANLSETFATGTAQSSVGFDAVVGQSMRNEVSERGTESWRNVESQTSEVANNISAASSELSDFARSATTTASAGGETSWTASEGQRQEVREAWTEVENFAETHGLSTDVAMQAMLAGKGGVGLPPGSIFELGVSLQAEGKLGSTSTESFVTAATAARDSSTTDAISTLISSSDRAFSGRTDTEGSSASNSVRTSFDRLEQSSQRLTSAYEEARGLERASAFLQSQDGSYNSRITTALTTELAENGYDREQIASIVNPQTTAGLVRQREIIGDMLPGMMEDLGLMGAPNSSVPTPSNRNGNQIITRPISMDHQNVNVPAPNHGNYAGRNANAQRLVGANFDSIYGQLADNGIAGNVDNTIATGRDAADQPVGGALWDRGKGIVGLGGGTSSSAELPMTPQDRDAAIRTIYGEANGENILGQAAVAHVIRNRVEDEAFGSSALAVTTAPMQFSAWNTDGSGNNLASSLSENSRSYQEIGELVDAVFAGQIDDPTGGATHYYSPAGMDVLVDQGYQSNTVPSWLNRTTAEREGGNVQIGGHIFSGMKS